MQICSICVVCVQKSIQISNGCPRRVPSPGADHKIFWGTVLPLDDIFWTEHRPGDRWNCKCSLRQTNKPVTETPRPSGKHHDPQPGLRAKPGSEEVFSDDHVYYPSDCRVCPFSDGLKGLFANLAGKKKDCNNCQRLQKRLVNNAPKDDTEQRIQTIIKELPRNLNEAEKKAIAQNCLDVEKALGVQKGAPMTIEQADKQSANPHYYDGRGYQNNCQACVPTFILRTRGFDITAGENTRRASNLNYILSLSENVFKCWKNIDGSDITPISPAEWAKSKNYNSIDSKKWEEYLKETCTEDGLYAFSCSWKTKGGHVTIIQNKGGQLTNIEPQVYNGIITNHPIDALTAKLTTFASRSDGIARVDNAMFDTNWIGIFQK